MLNTVYTYMIDWTPTCGNDHTRPYEFSECTLEKIMELTQLPRNLGLLEDTR